MQVRGGEEAVGDAVGDADFSLHRVLLMAGELLKFWGVLRRAGVSLRKKDDVLLAVRSDREHDGFADGAVPIGHLRAADVEGGVDYAPVEGRTRSVKLRRVGGGEEGVNVGRSGGGGPGGPESVVEEEIDDLGGGDDEDRHVKVEEDAGEEEGVESRVGVGAGEGVEVDERSKDGGDNGPVERASKGGIVLLVETSCQRSKSPLRTTRPTFCLPPKRRRRLPVALDRLVKDPQSRLRPRLRKPERRRLLDGLFERRFRHRDLLLELELPHDRTGVAVVRAHPTLRVLEVGRLIRASLNVVGGGAETRRARSRVYGSAQKALTAFSTEVNQGRDW